METLISAIIIVAILCAVYMLTSNSKYLWYYRMWAMRAHSYTIDIADHITPPENSPDYGIIRSADFRTADIAKRVRDTLENEIMPYIYWDNFWSVLFGNVFMRPDSYAYKVYQLQKNTMKELGAPTLDNAVLMGAVMTLLPTYLISYLSMTGIGIYPAMILLHFFNIVPAPYECKRWGCLQAAVKHGKPDWKTYRPPVGFKIPKEYQNASLEEFLEANLDKVEEAVKAEVKRMEEEEENARKKQGRK